MSESVQAEPTRRPATGGRPTRKQAAERDRRILSTAAGMFESRGFEGTTMDALAEAAGVGKPTVYARFGDKHGLFASVFRMRVEAVLAPLAAEARSAATGSRRADLAKVLRTIGTLLLQRSLLPEAIALNRVIVAEAQRFPELARLTHEEGWLRCVTIIADLLRSYERAGEIDAGENAEQTADLFLSLVLGRQQRSVMLGITAPDADLIARRASQCVDVFLYGMARRAAPLPGPARREAPAGAADGSPAQDR